MLYFFSSLITSRSENNLCFYYGQTFTVFALCNLRPSLEGKWKHKQKLFPSAFLAVWTFFSAFRLERLVEAWECRSEVCMKKKIGMGGFEGRKVDEIYAILLKCMQCFVKKFGAMFFGIILRLCWQNWLRGGENMEV